MTYQTELTARIFAVLNDLSVDLPSADEDRIFNLIKSENLKSFRNGCVVGRRDLGKSPEAEPTVA